MEGACAQAASTETKELTIIDMILIIWEFRSLEDWEFRSLGDWEFRQLLCALLLVGSSRRPCRLSFRMLLYDSNKQNKWGGRQKGESGGGGGPNGSSGMGSFIFDPIISPPAVGGT